MTTTATAPLAQHWSLDPSVVFLNHGSFGACPTAVLEAQQRWRSRMERQPVRFFLRELEAELATVRRELAAFVGADAEGMAFVSNATSGVNTVLRSLDLEPGDELLTTSQAYGACANALRYVAGRAGAKVVVVDVPFPVSGPDVVVAAVLDSVTPRTRLALLDHITSPTGVVYPIAALVAALAERGVESLVDGAHAPGMVPLDLDALGAGYFTGNCHKWLCTPKGAAFLYVRSDLRPSVRPLTISHGAEFPSTSTSRFRLEFDWTGTDDPTAWLCIGESLRFLEGLVPGGWPAIMTRNRELLLQARSVLSKALDVEPPCPESMLGTLCALPLPDGDGRPPRSPLYTDPLQDALLNKHSIEVPIVPWPGSPKRLVRVSAQLYNRIEDYERLASGLKQELGLS